MIGGKDIPLEVPIREFYVIIVSSRARDSYVYVYGYMTSDDSDAFNSKEICAIETQLQHHVFDCSVGKG